jgi:DNA-binding CsgD family transcriptional regulator
MSSSRQTLPHFRAGIVLVDKKRRPAFVNAEAVRLLAYPDEPQKIRNLQTFLANQIQLLIQDHEFVESPRTKTFMSGRRRYLRQVFGLGRAAKNCGVPTTALFLERAPPISVLIFRAIEQFHLTRREADVITLLLEGLTSKEIARRMSISHNTVNAFVRLIMGKMDISRRAAITGKILHAF